MNNQRIYYKSDKAITLVALIITIVVLIILASIAINLSISENGIFNRAKYARSKYINSQIKEGQDINELSNKIDMEVEGSYNAGNENATQPLNFEKIFESIEHVKDSSILTSLGTTPSTESIRIRSRELYVNSNWKNSRIQNNAYNKWIRSSKGIKLFLYI